MTYDRVPAPVPLSPGSREWDAKTYDTVSTPMTQRGNDAVERLRLSGDETVLDAGCGTGTVTQRLLERLPRGRVIGLDGSRQMLDVARKRLGDDPRVTLVEADLEEPLPLSEPVDAVVSTSTFHWISDHAALFRNLAAVLQPGGQLVVDCGGDGNIASVLAVLEELGHHDHPWTYATREDTLRRLDAAGFVDAEVTLTPRPAPLDPDDVETFLTTVVLSAHVAALGPEAGGELSRAVAARLPAPEIDFVRLNIVARRG